MTDTQPKNYLVEAFNGIVKGELKHNQESFSSCGTHMCLAGWSAALKVENELGSHAYAELVKDSVEREYEIDEEDLVADSLAKHLGSISLWRYWADKYSLSIGCSDALFCSYSSLILQYYTLERLFGGEYDILNPHDYPFS